MILQVLVKINEVTLVVPVPSGSVLRTAMISSFRQSWWGPTTFTIASCLYSLHGGEILLNPTDFFASVVRLDHHLPSVCLRLSNLIAV